MKTKTIFILGFSLNFIFNQIVSRYCVYQERVNGYNPIYTLSPIQIITLLWEAFVFIPFLYVINRRAVREEIKWLSILTGFFLLATCLGTVAMFILVLIEWLFPGMLM